MDRFASKVFLVVIAAHLALPAEARADGRLVTQGLQMQGLQMQGLQMQGVALRAIALRDGRIAKRRIAKLQLVGAQLFASLEGVPQPLGGAALVGAMLLGVTDAGRTVPLLVAAVEADGEDPNGETFLYDLRYRLGGRLAPACSPDERGERRALPLAGTWDRRGAHRPSHEYITFACTSGVLAKCARWGYRPWRSEGGRSLSDHHQACTRLARADYCGDGRSHTREGTVVNIYDDLGIQARALVEGMYFEAAWTPAGAYCVSKARLGILPSSVLLECPDRLQLPTLADLRGPDPCALRLRPGDRSQALLHNRSFALLR